MRVRLLSILAVLALVAAACGSRASDEDAAQADEAAQEGGDSGDTAEGDGDSSDGESDSAAVMFGTLESPCGPGDASGETDIGVYDDRIEIATISDPGGPVPGLNQSIFDSMAAFVDWCNDQGGVNGRPLDLTLLDAKLTDYRAQVDQACTFAFALVGDGGALDELGAQETVDCGLPSVPTYTVSAQKANSDLMYQSVPNPPGSYRVGPGRWLAEENPEMMDKAASIWGNIPITKTQQDRHVEGYESIGYDFIYQTATNVNEVNYGPVIRAMKDAGVEYFTFTATYEEAVVILQQMRDQNFTPLVDLEANMYDAGFPESGGSAVEGAYVRIGMWPFEEADENEAMSTYLEILEGSSPVAGPAMLGAQGFSSGLMFATAVKALGSDVTRAGLLDELSQITEWDGGGMFGVSNPAENEGSDCFIVMQVQDGEYVRAYPEEGFACPDDSVVELTGDYGTGATVAG